MWVAVLALVSVAAVAPAAHAATGRTSAAPTFRSGDGLKVLAVTKLDSRLYNIEVLTAALGRPVNVRVLVPADYAARPITRFPVLYLFHGTSGGASDWTVKGNAEPATAKLQLIVVMPDAGFDDDGGGWFTNWVDTKTALGPSQWETFHIDQLIPWVDANLRTIANRDGRAIAGLSQGGFGSTTYAARYPDLFASVAAFSGAPDIDYDPVIAGGATAVVEATAAGLDGVEPEAMFGSRVTDEINWQGHDPTDLIANLFPLSIYLYSGDGLPGPYDTPDPNPEAMGLEAIVHESTEGFIARAQQVGLPVHVDNYVYGTHSWPYWNRDLSEYLAPLMETFAHPPPAPRRITYESVAATWSQWGWTVANQRSVAQAWSELAGATADGFTLTGTGSATVTTPADYRPGSVELVHAVNPATKAVQALVVKADSGGHLHITVVLGGQAPVAVIGEPGLLPGDQTLDVTVARASEGRAS